MDALVLVVHLQWSKRDAVNGSLTGTDEDLGGSSSSTLNYRQLRTGSGKIALRTPSKQLSSQNRKLLIKMFTKHPTPSADV